MSRLQTLLTELCRDDVLDKKIKQDILMSWRVQIIDAKSNTIMDKYDAEEHFHNLEMIDNAIRIVGK